MIFSKIHSAKYFIFILILLLTSLYFTDENPVPQNTSEYNKLSNGQTKDFPNNYVIIPIKVPKKLSFCGEKVPLQIRDVWERMDREMTVNTYWHSSTIQFIKLSHRWFPVIESILKRNGVPDDFKYIALIESGFRNVTSPAKAVGFWQFLKGQARKYGLEVNKEVDERYNVEKSTEAACKYLKEAKEKFGNWTLAAASFNMGINGMEKQLSRQKTHSYYNLVLSDETSRYVFRAIAVREIMKHPRKYGFKIGEKDLYKPLKTKSFTFRGNIKNMAEFAEKYHINYKILKLYNPWLRSDKLTNKRRKKYKILLPLKIDSTVLLKE